MIKTQFTQKIPLQTSQSCALSILKSFEEICLALCRVNRREVLPSATAPHGRLLMAQGTPLPPWAVFIIFKK
jgi:hypothetical protein